MEPNTDTTHFLISWQGDGGDGALWVPETPENREAVQEANAWYRSIGENEFGVWSTLEEVPTEIRERWEEDSPDTLDGSWTTEEFRDAYLGTGTYPR